MMSKRQEETIKRLLVDSSIELERVKRENIRLSQENKKLKTEKNELVHEITHIMSTLVRLNEDLESKIEYIDSLSMKEQ